MRRANYDSAWKAWMKKYLRVSLMLFQPDLEEAIDWQFAPVFLDKAFHSAMKGSLERKKEVDLLTQIVMKSNGMPKWLLLHFEFQHRREDCFEKRMYLYHCRIFGHYQHEVISFAILGDPSPDWRPQSYGYSEFGCTAQFQFTSSKILDFRTRKSELEASSNPIGIVILAQLASLEGRGNPDFRYKARYRLMRLMIDKGYEREQIMDLLAFLEQVLVLEDEMQDKLYVEFDEREKPKTPLFEIYPVRKARKEGRAEGEIKTSRKLLETLLKKRFGTIPAEIAARLMQGTKEQLLAWFDKALDADELEKIFA